MTAASLSRTPLHDLHQGLGARMTAFAGYDMPLNYAMGVMKEHLHTRSAAGFFDISHMGQIVLREKAPGSAARALEKLAPINVVDLAVGRQRYGFFTNDVGGLLDDMMVARLPDRLLLICNAARKAADLKHLQTHIGEDVEIDMLDHALIALQGPQAARALARLAPVVIDTRFMDAREMTILGVDCVVIRSGYTGEDGFEISVPADGARALADTLLAMSEVLPVGLAARDTLRLEAGLCLYGADIDETTTPAEADIKWAIPMIRRFGGARAGGFSGAERILSEVNENAARKRVGLLPEGRAPVRAGAALFARENDSEPVGAVTSGGFGPSVEAPIAMGYAPLASAAPGARLFAELRGTRIAMTVTRLPFIAHRYKRA